MEPIPIWVRILWDAWGLRILVLLSFTLQVVLAIFGRRRKYMSSSWISVLVWSAYLMADWVATVALGKLSDAENSQGNNNELWAIWAPLLLLHLGGPDNITAYSLEDNKLWMRHLLGLAVQIFVVIYVILMSWKNSWFLFMSFPAFIAGVTKYGERTWALKSVSENEYRDNIPLYSFRTYGSPSQALVKAHERLMDFTYRLEDTFNPLSQLGHHYPFPHDIATETMWDAVDVVMGLVYDLLYTKASKIYILGGCVVRFISFGSTVIVLVGLTIQTIQFNLKEGDDKIDIAITWVLIVGALVLEVYAAIAIFSSHWMMLWLIKKGRREWVKKLSDRFPWLFKKKKNWSNMLGQFDLVDYWLKQRKRSIISLVLWRTIRSVIGSKYEEKWNRSLHKTQVSVCPLVRQAISNLCKRENGHSNCHFFDKGNDDQLNNLGNLLNLLDRERNNLWHRDQERDRDRTVGSWGWNWKVQLDRYCGRNRLQGWNRLQDPDKDWDKNHDPDRATITFMHLATKICYTQSETETNDDDSPDSTSWKEDRKVSKYLSDYMMYLLMLQPSLLPQSGPSILEDIINDPMGLVGETQEVGEAWRHLLMKEGTPWAKIVGILNGIDDKGRRWELVKLQWWRILQSAFNNGFRLRDAHLQQLTQGGEFLTFLLIYYTPPRHSTPHLPDWLIPKVPASS